MKAYYAYTFAEIVSKGFMTVIVLLLAKILSDYEYELLGISLAIAGFVTPVLSVSLEVLLAREERKETFSMRDREKYFATQFFTAVLLSLVLFFCINLVNNILLLGMTKLYLITIIIYSLSLSIFLIAERSITFNLEYAHSARLIVISVLLCALYIAISYIVDTISPSSRLHGQILGILVSMIFVTKYSQAIRWRNFSIGYLKKMLHTAKWITPQILFNGAYVYGDRLIAADNLNASEFKQYFLIAQFAFMLSFLNRIINTYWQSQYFNKESMRDNKTIATPLIFACITYLSFISFGIWFFSYYFDDIYSESFDIALMLMSTGFLVQLNYHLTNAALLWEEKYNKQFVISVVSGGTSIVLAFLLFPVLEWYLYPLVFLGTTLAQFATLNFFLVKTFDNSKRHLTNMLLVFVISVAYSTLLYRGYVLRW